MADYTVLQMSQAGVAPTLAAVAAVDTFYNDGRTYLHVKNGSAASINVTVDSLQPCSQGGTHNVVVAVPAGAERVIGPFEPARFNDGSSRATVRYSAIATVTAAAIRLG